MSEMGKQFDKAMIKALDETSLSTPVPGTRYTLVVTREQVEGGNFVAYAAGLLAFSSSAEHARTMAGNTEFMFVGWSDDPEPLWENEELIGFLENVTDIWPYWVHFLDKDDPGARAVLRLVIGVRGVARIDGKQVLASMKGKSAAHMVRTLSRLQAGALSLGMAHGLGSDMAGGDLGELAARCLEDAPAVT